MYENDIRTAKFYTFDDYDKCYEYLNTISESDNCDCQNNPLCKCNFDYVIKASGLAGGKGVVLPKNFHEAFIDIEDFMISETHGDAGKTIIIEEKLIGEEVSVFAFCNGKQAFLMPQAQDNKRVWDDDKGLNTGGMGAYAPVSVLNSDEIQELQEYMNRVVDKLEYTGILYAGVMKTQKGIYLLEFNCRFGDPEAQVVLNLLESDFTEIIRNCLNGEIGNFLEIRLRYKCCVISH